MVEIKNSKEITISASVPICPRCSAGIKKIYCGKDILYKCMDCNRVYKLLRQGQADTEMICEELEYTK